jgi:hypothetical protein
LETGDESPKKSIHLLTGICYFLTKNGIKKCPFGRERAVLLVQQSEK